MPDHNLADAAEILDQLGAYVYTKDLDGRYVYANALVQGLFGHPLSEITGKDDSAFFDLQRSNDLRENDLNVMATGDPIMAREVDVIKETGETRVYWTVKTPVRDDNGDIAGLLGMSVDITAAQE